MTDCASGICGTGGWTGPLPGDPDISVSAIALTATPVFGGIDVNWTYPTLNAEAVAHTLLYRGDTTDFNGAVQRAVVAGNFYYDKVDAGTQFYYWIRIVSVNGTLGDLIGPASAMTQPLSEAIMDQLSGQIDVGVLAQSLRGDLDRITVLETALQSEITSREDGTTSLAQAIQDAQDGIAQALTFIGTESQTRSDQNNLMAGQLTDVATTSGQNLAAVQTLMQANIDTVNGRVTGIGALYTAKVTVNGLVGGFGVYNDGSSVEAGFDVDTFWVGSTADNKRKPFIISSGVTFIDQAMINSLTFSKLQDANGSFIVDENGRIQAQYLRVSSASIDALAVKTAHIDHLAVDTLQIAGNAVTVPAFISAGVSDLTMTYTLTGEPGVPYSVFILVSLTQSFSSTIELDVNGTMIWTEAPLAGTILCKGWVVSLAPGTHSIRVFSTDGRNTNGAAIFALATKR